MMTITRPCTISMDDIRYARRSAASAFSATTASRCTAGNNVFMPTFIGNYDKGATRAVAQIEHVPRLPTTEAIMLMTGKTAPSPYNARILSTTHTKQNNKKKRGG